MKKLFAVAFTLLLLALMITPVSAQGPTSYSSTVTVTNITEETGVITLSFVNPDGTTESEVLTESIGPLETKFFSSFPISSGFKGAMFISSSVPVASTSDIMGKNSSGATMNYASFVGVSAGSTKVFLPLLMDSNYGFNTYFSIQNTSGSNVDVSIEYSDGTVVADILNLQPNAAVVVDNQEENHTAKKFSAILNATGDIAVTVVEWADGSNGKQLFAFNGFSENQGTTNPVISMVNQNNYGYWTSIPIQNLGSVDSVVTLTYKPTKAGTECSETLTIPAGGLAEFGAFAHVFTPQTPGTNCVRGQKFVGAAVVTGNSENVPLIGLMNQSTTLRGNYEKAGALMSINPALATSEIVFPEAYQWFGGSSWWSSITIVNMSGGTLAAGDISCRGIGTANSNPVDISWSNPSDLVNGSGWITDLYDDWGPLPNGFLGGIICTSASSGEIIGTLNNLGHTASATLDSYTLYEGINVSP
ncbi:MAG: hypothetical protein SVR94_14530 [Pseudomonadota bacterium]|nr:hypothetical protein [Pseudomonadota bacterium]